MLLCIDVISQRAVVQQPLFEFGTARGAGLWRVRMVIFSMVVVINVRHVVDVKVYVAVNYGNVFGQ